MTNTWTSLCLTLSFCMFMASELLCMEQEVKPSCAETDEECEFFWTIDYMWTMNVYDKEPKAMRPVLIRNGSLLINNCDAFIPMTTEDSAVTADGRYVVIFAINNQFPGPNIVVYENQTIVVHVKNNLINEAVTIHWHGLPQEGTPWMDGVSMLSQYPITRGETFTYRFRASPPGTFWYHSHHGTMRSNGLSGPLVILPREDPRPKIAEELEKDFILTLTDWYVDLTVFERYTLEISSGYRYQKGFDALCEKRVLTGLDGSPVNLQDFESALINGKGWIFDENRNPIAPELPLEKFEFASGKIYKFRLINIGSIQAYRFSIDQHHLTVIAADGFDVEPLDVESLVIAPGERYDVLITADQIPQSYWIRAETLLARLMDGSRIEPDQTLGIVRYIGANDTLPSSQRRNCTKTDPCVILGCPFAQEVYDIFGMNNKCVYDSELIPTIHNLLRTPVPIPEPGEEILEMFLNFHFQELVRTHAAINGRQHLDPPFPFQLSVGQQLEDNIPELVQCNASACEVGCTCTHMLKVQKGQILQFILTSQESVEEGPAHPIHLHGTHFHVLKTAFPQYNSNGMVSKPSPDIISSEYYTSVSWANKDWYGDNIPGLNLKNPPIKDTLLFTSEGYSVIRFRANNPGFWLLHCHLKPHSIMGMSMILQVGETSGMPPVPRDYPGRFVSGTYPTGNNYWYQFGIVMCCTVLVLLIVVQLVCLTNQRRRIRGSASSYRYVSSRCSPDDETTRLVGNNYKH